MGTMAPCHSPATARATRPCTSGWLTRGLGPGALSWMVELDVSTCMLVPGAQAASVENNIIDKIKKRPFFISAPELFNFNLLVSL